MSDITRDTRSLRNALGCFSTGIAIITVLDTDEQPIGLTANSFAAVSLDPALAPWAEGASVFPGCRAVFEVANETAHAGGDHTIFVGRIDRFSGTPDLASLLFHADQYRQLA